MVEDVVDLSYSIYELDYKRKYFSRPLADSNLEIHHAYKNAGAHQHGPCLSSWRVLRRMRTMRSIGPHVSSISTATTNSCFCVARFLCTAAILHET